MPNVTLVWATPDTDALIAKMARVSNPENEGNTATAPRLIRYLIRNRHWSPFEMCNMCVEIHTTRDIGRQLLRHRSIAFQEFCVAGATEITFEEGPTRGRKRSKKIRIDDLWRRRGAGRIQKMQIRVYDESTREFTTSRIREVFQTGVKPTFRLTLENGRVIECTKEHQFFTDQGFQSLEHAIGLELVGDRAVLTRPDVAFGCNGAVAYMDCAWLQQAKMRAIDAGTGLPGIASDAGCTTHTIRKWLRRHGLQFSKIDVAKYSPPWNKGRTGYSNGPHSMQTIEKMKQSARRGSASNLWRGGADRGERLKIADWCNANRAMFLRQANFKCGRCDASRHLELHHRDPVALRPDLAYDPGNIDVLCRACHRSEHRTQGHPKMWRERSRGHTLTLHWSKVKNIEYVGEQMTYDLEVEHGSHNYIGNGIVVHNSQRYAEVAAWNTHRREARMQDPKNRQNSVPCEDDDVAWNWDAIQGTMAETASRAYQWAINAGIAKEVARAVLPEGMTPTRMYANASIRSWLHFCDVRRGHGTQKEAVAIADEVWGILREVCPNVVEAWEMVESAK